MSPMIQPTQRHRRPQHALLLLGSVLLLHSLTGCTMPDERLGYSEYADGTLRHNLAAEPAETGEAARRALEQMGMDDIAVDATEGDAMLAARTGDDDRIAIDVRRIRPGITRIEIRTGVLGDRGLSQRILEKTERALLQRRADGQGP